MSLFGPVDREADRKRRQTIAFIMRMRELEGTNEVKPLAKKVHDNVYLIAEQREARRLKRENK